MTIQAFAQITVTDKETLLRYREKVAATLAKHSGSVVAADPAPIVLEAATDAPSTTALLSFPNVEAAQNWIDDPDLADVHALRNSAGKSTIVVLPA
ncbi:MAG: DUF1330 domain-containing protein [Roseibium sp.]